MIEFGKGTLYATEPNGEQFRWADIFSSSLEVNTCSPNEIPEMYYNLVGATSASFEGTITGLEYLDLPAFEPAKTFWFEHDIEILSQARWHKKKRINKKWLKRYGMKSDTVRMRANARAMSHDYLSGEFDFETDSYEYIWRPDQRRRCLKIELGEE